MSSEDILLRYNENKQANHDITEVRKGVCVQAQSGKGHNPDDGVQRETTLEECYTEDMIPVIF